MASGSTTDVTAKKIGAQLQSLLRIPPIKKEDAQDNVGGPTSKDSSKLPLPGVSLEEKENSRSNELHPGSDHFKRNVPSSTSSEPRDRFGRPFQSIDRRGRGFTNGPKRMSGPPIHRDPPIQVSQDSGSSDSIQGGHHHGILRGGDTTPARGRQHQPPGRGVHTPPSLDKRGPPPPPPSVAQRSRVPIHPEPLPEPPNSVTVSVDDRMHHKAPPSSSSHSVISQPKPTYEPSPRSSRVESPRPPEQDLVEPSIRVLLRKPECPWDIRKYSDFVYEFEPTTNHINDVLNKVFKRHQILYIQRKSPRFPKARYYCKACNYHLDTLYSCLTHIMQERHANFEKWRLISNTLVMTPPPSAEHTSYLTQLLNLTSKTHGMNHIERLERLEVVNRLTQAIKESNLDCQVSVFGSSLSGFGFRDSNLNININVCGDPSSPSLSNSGDAPPSPQKNQIQTGSPEFSEIMAKLIRIIKQLPHVTEDTVKEVYTTKCVSIQFEESKSRATCVVHFNNNNAVLTAQLFAEYEKIDPRVKPLVHCFRYWARICDIDDQQKGFLPAHCYALMVIHYLQKNKFVLPFLHELPRVNKEQAYTSAEEAMKHWSTQNTQSLGELWIGLLKYYGSEFCYRNRLVTVTHEPNMIDRTEKQWNRKMCIEDPILPKSNLARGVSNNKVCDYIIDRIKLAYLYFGTPREKSGPIYEGIIISSEVMDHEVISYTKEGSKPTTSQALQRMVRQIQVLNMNTPKRDETKEDWQWAIEPISYDVRMAKVCWKQETFTFVFNEDCHKLHSVLFQNEHHYEFKRENFSDGSIHPIMCRTCGADGHLKHNCPEETIPPYLPVVHPSPLTLSRLNKAIAINYEREVLDANDVNTRTRIVDEIKSILRPVFPFCGLTLFGSTYNGFGMHSSDVDICFTLGNVNCPPGERAIRMINVNYILESIVGALKASNRMTEIISIPSAKVPIVKFRHVHFKLDGDISLYNQLSFYNTELLKLYVNLDSRVGKLGIFLKKLVKLCDVGDASKGSLSSYAYILMLIHFLQKHTVPVLPVLQELPVPEQHRENIICDTHIITYCKNLSVLTQLWEGYGKNKESVSQLWLAFLNYYVEKFDHELHVISISQSAPLTRTEKSWHTDGLAIVDPFDKTHNLGSGLTRRMSVHILRTFQKCRAFFHESTDMLRNDINFMRYYLDARRVRYGNPPIDRQCRLCYRIGHIARNCTYTNKPEDDGDRRGDDDDMGVLDVTPTVTPTATPREEPVSVIRNSVPSSETNPLSYFMNREDMKAAKKPIEQVTPDVSPWPPVQPQVISPPKKDTRPVQLPNGISPFEKILRTPFADNVDMLKAPRKPVQENVPPQNVTNFGVYSQAEIEGDKEEVQPPKEVMFFGDIGNTNSDGEQIQAMLQKNDGVTFTFDLAHRQHEQANAEMGGMSGPEMLSNPGVSQMQAPPGFCPPGSGYMGSAPSTVPHGMPYIGAPGNQAIMPGHPGGQPPYSMPPPMGMHMPPSVAYGPPPHTMQIPFPPVIPVGGVPFDNGAQLNGESTDQNQGVVPAATAPPPGFAPLPTGNNNCIRPSEMMRPFPAPPPYTVPPVTVYSIAHVPVGYQPPNTYTSAPSGMESNEQQPPLGSYTIESPMPTPLVTYAITQTVNMMHQQPPIANLAHMPGGFQQQLVPLNVGLPNGQLENGDDAVGLRGDNFMKTSEGMCNPEYGALHMNPPVSSYGLSLSQAHHGPVVSALQMQHSQHHPMHMQGGHFPHPNYPGVRTFVPLGAFQGGHYSFPMNVSHLPHGENVAVNNNPAGEGV